MKEQKTFFNIITIITNFLATLVFFLPTWYFLDSMTIDGETSVFYSTPVRTYDQVALEEIEQSYISNGYELNLNFPKTIFIMVIITISFSLLLIIATIFHNVKSTKLTRRLQMIISLSIVLSTIATLVLSIMFTKYSNIDIVKDESVTHNFVVEMTTGLYVFIVLEVAGVLSSYISNHIKENN